MAFIGEERGVHRVLVGKPERKRPLGRPRRRWEDQGVCELGWGEKLQILFHKPATEMSVNNGCRQQSNFGLDVLLTVYHSISAQ
jgi:hypothetical protein